MYYSSQGRPKASVATFQIYEDEQDTVNKPKKSTDHFCRPEVQIFNDENARENLKGGSGKMNTGSQAPRKVLQSIVPTSRKEKLKAWKQNKLVKKQSSQKTTGIENTKQVFLVKTDPKCLQLTSQVSVSKSGNTTRTQTTTKATSPSSTTSSWNSSSSYEKGFPQLRSSSKLEGRQPPLKCGIFARIGSQWQKRGTGKGSISFVPSLQNRTSLQVRARTTLQLLANFSISKDVKLVAHSSKSWTLSAEDFATDCEPQFTHFMLRFGSVEDALQFETLFNQAYDHNGKLETTKLTHTDNKENHVVTRQENHVVTRQESHNEPTKQVQQPVVSSMNSVNLLQLKVQELEIRVHEEVTARKKAEEKYNRLVVNMRTLLSNSELDLM